MATKSARRARRKYTAEFKTEAVKLVLEDGLSRAQAARDLGVTESVLGRWVQKAREVQVGDALTVAERAELKRLRKEVSTLRKERDILKKQPPSSRRKPCEPVPVHRGGEGDLAGEAAVPHARCGPIGLLRVGGLTLPRFDGPLS